MCQLMKVITYWLPAPTRSGLKSCYVVQGGDGDQDRDDHRQ